uniref:Uncharacterized protein n=1 Tax=viral metagenome TaxID=1070528 RepID=A0A6M3L4I4_9ZZZZ
MKVFTIETCWECPSYRPSSSAYHDEYGRCDRVEGLEVMAHHEPPRLCPLKDWKEE